MGLWWLESGWGDACCSRCGANIQSTGGDPDWGLCWPCKSAEEAERKAEADAYNEAYREHCEQLEREGQEVSDASKA